jgi:hypothetical protein
MNLLSAVKNRHAGIYSGHLLPQKPICPHWYPADGRDTPGHDELWSWRDPGVRRNT